MQQLTSGQFFGDTTNTLQVNGMILTDTAYTHAFVDWHYHENMYFTFLLQGRVIEGNKKETYHCTTGSLLFHNWQEPHYNILPPGKTRGFHLELTPFFLQQYFPNATLPAGSIKIESANQKLAFYKMFLEYQQQDAYSPIAISNYLGTCLTQISEQSLQSKAVPSWVNKIKELLYYDAAQPLTLTSLAQQLQIHPGHLSRDFAKYFHCNLGEYIRSVKLQKALQLLVETNLNLSEIAAASGFADQSHFIRLFKRQLHMLPVKARKQLTNINTAR